MELLSNGRGSLDFAMQLTAAQDDGEPQPEEKVDQTGVNVRFVETWETMSRTSAVEKQSVLLPTSYLGTFVLTGKFYVWLYVHDAIYVLKSQTTA